MFDEFDIIHTYTRKQALEDRMLIDVSETAREASSRWPVAVTAAVWAEIADIPEGSDQDEMVGIN